MRPYLVPVLLGVLLLTARPLSAQPEQQRTTVRPVPQAATRTEKAETKSEATAAANPEPLPLNHPWTIWYWLTGFGSLAIVGAMVFAGIRPKKPYIRELGPSFVFWLSLLYLMVLTLLGLAYVTNAYEFWKSLRDGLGEIMPVAVPWFGAVGAVLISIQGVYWHNDAWDPKYNYWHIGRPLVGAVVAVVAYFLFKMTVKAAGAPAEAPSNNPVVYYVVAFVVGYREESFRSLLLRVVDLILKPGDTPPVNPVVSFAVGGNSKMRIDCGTIVHATTAEVTVDIHNEGTVPLVTPVVTVTATAPAPAATFQLVNDHVTGGGDLAPGQSRSVDVRFSPGAAIAFEGTLSVAAANLPAPKTIPVSGTGT